MFLELTGRRAASALVLSLLGFVLA
ncbi:MAG: hypothetical protein K0S65_6292, partial [Labilithrix sp.]|nr:hypothetical protein [Labilithrix sp.]